MADERSPTDPIWNAVEAAIFATLARITAPESESVSLRDTAGLLTGTIASLVGAVEEARHEPNRSPVQYLPLSEVTDGHVAAYQRAFKEAYSRDLSTGAVTDRINEATRVGLAAIRWPSREVEASPEMRELHRSHFIPGDTVTVTALVGPNTSWSRGSHRGVPWDELDFMTEIHLRDLAEPAVIAFTRAVFPLPDKPGAVIRCRIAGLDGVRVAELEAGGGWMPTGIDRSYRDRDVELVEVLHAPAGSADYVPLIDGEDPR